jgi:hypothetical protein
MFTDGASTVPTNTVLADEMAAMNGFVAKSDDVRDVIELPLGGPGDPGTGLYRSGVDMARECLSLECGVLESRASML